MEFIAHKRKTGEEQLLTTHLSEVGKIASQLSSKLGVENVDSLSKAKLEVAIFEAKKKLEDKA